MHGNIIEARDVEFFKNMFPMKITSYDDHISYEIYPKMHACSSDMELRRSKRIRKETNFGLDLLLHF